MSSHTAISKKQPITLAQLSSYDDILTDVLVDHAYYWTTIPKNRPSYRPSRGVTEEEITKIIQSHLIVDPDLEVAESQLLATSGLKRFYNALKTPKEQSDFRAHLHRYMRIHLPDCPFEVTSTNRYTIYNHEAAITARKYIKRGQPIKYLSGIQVAITAKEDKELAKRKKDFSIIISARNKCAALFMGPARFANHDCNANARLVITSQAGIEIFATRSIEVGDEITVSYAENYFGEDNCECLCKTCEDNVVNGWAPGEGSATVKKSIEDSTTEGYSLRRRRRDGSCASGSRTSSVTPDIRPRVRRLKPKPLNSGQPRESSCNSPAPQNILRQKSKREYESLQSPPITPAKRVKTLEYEVESALISGGVEKSSDDTTSSEHSASISMSGDMGVMTDVTTPEEDIQKTALNSPSLTPGRPRIPALEGEVTDLLSLADFSRTPSVPPVSGTEISIPEGSNAESSARANISLNINATNSNISKSNTVGQDDAASPPNVLASPVSTASIHEETLPMSVTSPQEVPGAVDQERTRGRPRNDERQTDEESKTAESVGEVTQVPNKRTPGDYTLTPVLLSEASMAWIHCTNCGDAFVQPDAYYTRSSCFRCERHSKLYGYPWPKTEKEGPTDKEERVLDHRTIHRFLRPDDEAKIRGRGCPPSSSEPRTSDTTPAKRGPGRPRKSPTSNPTAPPREMAKETAKETARETARETPKETPLQTNDEITANMRRPQRQKKPTLKAAAMC
ncbi:hypothetical protein GGR50DRAFT_671662 [Xylaria sp. CBS 124048]|nr:hypothetical protein GGR50DRAFT_671662 [Xylaria sp. CBS 124048]